MPAAISNVCHSFQEVVRGPSMYTVYALFMQRQTRFSVPSTLSQGCASPWGPSIDLVWGCVAISSEGI